MKTERGAFTQTDYQRRSPFAGFLPGIAGKRGIPVWAYYVNRGQGLVSFGVQDKDHSIMEFYPAHAAYEVVQRKGFRTFVRSDGDFVEAFSDPKTAPSMTIHMNAMSIMDDRKDVGLRFDVKYFVLPEERLGALVRRVTLTNTSDHTRRIELLDGMPAVIPYGVGNDSMKNMTETTKAWMMSDVRNGAAVAKVRASMEDTAEVREVKGLVFGFAVNPEGLRMRNVTDPYKIFGYDTGFTRPEAFLDKKLVDWIETEENHVNEVPCFFFVDERVVAPGESYTITEVYGQAESPEILDRYLMTNPDADYFAAKELRADGLADEITDPILSKTNHTLFDAYAKSCYLDNGLRGGFPVRLGHNKIFYLYSRKHGDLERDYNYFSMTPEYDSQGNGNFRDVIQNRRMDAFFSPFVERSNIKTFFNLLQPDAYNPLSVEKQTFRMEAEEAKRCLSNLTLQEQAKVLPYICEEFTPGGLRMLLEEVQPEMAEEVFQRIIDFSEGGTVGSFGEGYWCDHWTYLMDLVEEYLNIWPEKEEEMLLEGGYHYFAPEVKINPRHLRYQKTSRGIRQYHALAKERLAPKDKVYRDQQGKALEDNLIAHMILLATLKFATLDAYGMGIEMEGGKPGWYDALNGLPGMLGSAMSETLELLRLVEYLDEVVRRYTIDAELPCELVGLLKGLAQICLEEEENLLTKQKQMTFWNKINDAREDYREKVYTGLSGTKEMISCDEILLILDRMKVVLRGGIRKAYEYGQGIMPTYFSFEVTRYEEAEDGIKVLDLELKTLPKFLEGSVHAMKVYGQGEESRRLYRGVRQSALFDEKLHMYKVNAALDTASIEIGRCRNFTAGWLENESVFLHMEYKYLLEVLKSGQYREFFQDMRQALIPFLDPQVYGRSTLENSSFIASSANPDPKIHGKGYVARLSGSTVEFLNMWKIMMFGGRIFSMKGDCLELNLRPALPEYLIPENGQVTARLMGSCDVTYHFTSKKDYTPSSETIKSMLLIYCDGSQERIQGGTIRGEAAEAVRNGDVRSIYAEVE